jgi:hypothetical protein
MNLLLSFVEMRRKSAERAVKRSTRRFARPHSPPAVRD